MSIKPLSLLLLFLLRELIFTLHLSDTDKGAVKADHFDFLADNLGRDLFVLEHLSFKCGEHFVGQEHDGD